MLKASEAMAITISIIEARMEMGKTKAHNSIESIEMVIRYDAEKGLNNTVIYPLRMYDFDSDEERRAYIKELTKILADNGYKISYNTANRSMKISWGF